MEIMQHIFKMQEITVLLKYIKWIYRGVFFTSIHIQGVSGK